MSKFKADRHSRLLTYTPKVLCCLASDRQRRQEFLIGQQRFIDATNYADEKNVVVMVTS